MIVSSTTTARAPTRYDGKSESSARLNSETNLHPKNVDAISKPAAIALDSRVPSAPKLDHTRSLMVCVHHDPAA